MRNIKLKMLIAGLFWAGSGLLAADSPPELLQPVKPSDDSPAALETASLDGDAFRIRFGLKDQNPTDWGGSVTVSQGKVAGVSGWRWAQGDRVTGDAKWAVRTRRQPPQNPGRQANQNPNLPVADSGVIVHVIGATANASIDVNTAAGNFEFSASDVVYGKKLGVLDGAATVERVPPTAAFAATTDDEDYPAAAPTADGAVYVAYLSFTHGKDFPGQRERVAVPGSAPENQLLSPGKVHTIDKPEDFDYLREPVGGERVLLKSYRNGKWSNAIDIGEKSGSEFYRPAAAVDGTGKVWVFFSAHQDTDKTLDTGNWELLARTVDPATGMLGEIVNISRAPGSDFEPVATTDSTGRIWTAWIGGREKTFNVYASHQTAAGKGEFTPAARVSNAPGNEWEPSIAADKTGNVTVAWDTYAKGDYDVYIATAGGKHGDSFTAPTPVAASLLFEARPSIAYDGSGKLWVAWEQSGNGWGKDFGALKKVGVSLYANRSIIAKVFDPSSGQWFSPPDLYDATGGRPPIDSGGAAPALRPNGKPMGLGAAARARNGTVPCYPRLSIDENGNVWIAYRGRENGNYRVGVGSVWFEFVTRLDGDHWLPGAWLPHSNNILDNRPALVPQKGGGELVLFSGDARGEVSQLAPVADPHTPDGEAATPSGTTANFPKSTEADNAPPITGAGGNQNRRGKNAAAFGADPNNNLFAAELPVSAAPASPSIPALVQIPAEIPATPIQRTADENQIVQTARDYVYDFNGEKLKLWRGEFHRHTELSPDGGGDGGLLDMWRYALDAVDFDWIGDGDHDFGNGREYSWWTTEKAVTLFTLPGRFTPVYSYERSVGYPEGHRNVMLAERGIRSLPRLPLSKEEDGDKPAPDTQLLYKYLHYFNGVTAAHTTATDMGTDWRNNDPEVEPFVEVYQGDRNSYERPDAPRTAPHEAELKHTTPEQESLGGWRPKGFINLALLKGYRLAFESSSDHISTHLSYCNVLVTDPSRKGILDAIKKRRVYGSTDNVIADVRVKAGGVDHLFGEEFSTTEPITINVHFIAGLPLENVTIIKDDKVVYTASPNSKNVKFDWTDPSPTVGKTSYYYVRGQQIPDAAGAEGEIVWASPFWIKYEAH